MLLGGDLPRYLSIRVLRKEAVMYPLTLGANPLLKPLASLASREAWLTRLFLCIIWSGLCKARPVNVQIPDNLVAFVSNSTVSDIHISSPTFLQSTITNDLVASRNV